MRIESIQIENFRGIDHLDLTFDPHFNLLVGDNGSGKTSILSAVSVALGIWHSSGLIRGSKQWRNIMDHEIREVPAIDENGDRQFVLSGPAKIAATGLIGDAMHSWGRRKRARRSRTVDFEDKESTNQILEIVAARGRREASLPLLAYYGAGRAWMPSNDREFANLFGDLKSRAEDGYYDCLNERIRIKDIIKWFVLQAAKRDESGRFKPAFEAVRLALTRGIPGIDEIYWSHTKGEVVVSINGIAQPFTNLSDGQRTMASTLADLAIRATTLNSHLLGGGNSEVHPERVLDETPGVVLIDEIDVHLHPSWQRSVVHDLMTAFPSVQFITTSHSAQVLGEVPAKRVWILGEQGPRHPSVSYADSNWTLEHFMGADAESRNEKVKGLLDEAENSMDEGELKAASNYLEEVNEQMGGADGEVTRLTASLETLKLLAREND